MSNKRNSGGDEDGDQNGYVARFVIVVLSTIFIVLFLNFINYISIINSVIAAAVLTLALAFLLVYLYRKINAEDIAKIPLIVVAKLKSWDRNRKIGQKNPFRQDQSDKQSNEQQPKKDDE